MQLQEEGGGLHPVWDSQLLARPIRLRSSRPPAQLQLRSPGDERPADQGAARSGTSRDAVAAAALEVAMCPSLTRQQDEDMQGVVVAVGVKRVCRNGTAAAGR